MCALTKERARAERARAPAASAVPSASVPTVLRAPSIRRCVLCCWCGRSQIPHARTVQKATCDCGVVTCKAGRSEPPACDCLSCEGVQCKFEQQECVCGTCQCIEGWTGDQCDCEDCSQMEINPASETCVCGQKTCINGYSFKEGNGEGNCDCAPCPGGCQPGFAVSRCLRRVLPWFFLISSLAVQLRHM